MDEICDAEKFCNGLKQLAAECDLSAVAYSVLGVTSYTFLDGSFISCLEAHKQANLI